MKTWPAYVAISLLAATCASALASTSMRGASPVPAVSDLGNPPPASAIVTNAGLEWVWANPCPGMPSDVCGGGNPGVVLHHGFHFASAAEWMTWGSLAAFQGSWGGVTCASPEFSLKWDHCDMSDMLAGLIWDSALTDPASASNDYAETFLVRTIPEPGTYLLMIAGFGVLGFLARRRQRG